MKCLLIKPIQKPKIVNIESGLEPLQKIVGGNIQVIYPFADPVGLIINEEGKIEGLPLNRALRDYTGEIYDIVAGNLLIVGLTEDAFETLSDKMIEKYYKLFEYPEHFISVNGAIYSRPYTEMELRAANQEE